MKKLVLSFLFECVVGFIVAQQPVELKGGVQQEALHGFCLQSQNIQCLSTGVGAFLRRIELLDFRIFKKTISGTLFRGTDYLHFYTRYAYI